MLLPTQNPLNSFQAIFTYINMFSDLSNGLQYPPKYFLAISTNMNNSVFCFSPKSKHEKINKIIIKWSLKIKKNNVLIKYIINLHEILVCNPGTSLPSYRHYHLALTPSRVSRVAHPIWGGPRSRPRPIPSSWLSLPRCFVLLLQFSLTFPQSIEKVLILDERWHLGLLLMDLIQNPEPELRWLGKPN